MLVNLKEFHESFMQDVLASASSNSLQTYEAFNELVFDELVETGDVSIDFELNYFQHLIGNKPMEVSGYSYEEDRKILSLFISEFSQNSLVSSIPSKTIEMKFKRLKNFLDKSLTGLYKNLEETADYFPMTFEIYKKYQEKKIDKVRFILVSDGQLSKLYRGIGEIKVREFEIEPIVVDIEYLYNNYKSQNADTSFEVDVNLPTLKVPIDTNQYESYLAYINGNQLYDIYEKFGKKLLEQNVRTFLQFKGGINKGIKNTLDGAPEMFFAYNNGITATASSLEFDGKGNISKIHNLQIVNGGQTTSSIYAAKKNSKIDISKVNVQMKISVVAESGNHSEFVSKVAEYANTQNKVNKSDFFSNSPFHKEFKLYSEKIWIPSNSQNRSRWFYERVRGEYLNEQSYYTQAEKRKFEKINPRDKKIDKTLLAKCENAWMQKPDIVSKGAQYSFSTFAEYITNEIEKNDLAISEEYYKNAVARVILFRGVEEIVSKASWYNGGFRANIVAYTISYLSFLTEKNKKHFNFSYLWETQNIPKDLTESLEIISEFIHGVITSPPEGQGNVSQWSKKKVAWENIKKIPFDVVIPDRYLLSNKENTLLKREEKNLKRLDKGIEIQSFIVECDRKVWVKLYKYYNEDINKGSINVKEHEILMKMSNSQLSLPSEKQSKVLYNLYVRAKNEGLILQ